MKGLLVAGALCLLFVGCGDTTTYVSAPAAAVPRTISCGNLFGDPSGIQIGAGVRATGIRCADALAIVGVVAGGQSPGNSGRFQVEPLDRHDVITHQEADLDHVRVKNGFAAQWRTYSYYSNHADQSRDDLILVSENASIQWSSDSASTIAAE